MLDLFLAQADHCSISVPVGHAVVDSYANGLSLALANLSWARLRKGRERDAQTDRRTPSGATCRLRIAPWYPQQSRELDARFNCFLSFLSPWVELTFFDLFLKRNNPEAHSFCPPALSFQDNLKLQPAIASTLLSLLGTQVGNWRGRGSGEVPWSF